MANQIPGIVQDSHDVDGVAAAAVNHKVAGIAHEAKNVWCVIPARAQMIRANSGGKFGALLGAVAQRIAGDVAENLFEKIPITRGGRFAELLSAPLQNFTYVAPRRGREKDLNPAGGISHAGRCAVRALRWNGTLILRPGQSGLNLPEPRCATT